MYFRFIICNGVYAFDDSSCGKNRSSMQSIRLHGLKDLENTSFHFGSKKLTDQAPDLKKSSMD